MAHYPYVDLSGSAGGCTSELTQIAAGSTQFSQANDYLATDEYYIGTNGQGWAGCNLDIVNKPSWQLLPINNTNCAIPLPIGVKAGDKIKICGIASGTADNMFNNGSAFGIVLNELHCGGVGPSGWFQNNILKQDFTFSDNHVCWSAEYTFSGKFDGCTTMFTLGFGTEESRTCKLTWTFDLETICVGPCAFEHTNVAANGIKFNAGDSYSNGQWYGFTEKCGWRGPGDQWIDLNTNVLPQAYGHNGIKLPVNLIPGDIIQICGLASGVDNNPFNDSSFFGCKLQYALCSEAETIGGKDWPTYDLGSAEKEFYYNSTCFSLQYVVPAGSPLLACNTMLLVGFGTQEIEKDCLVSYTLNVRKPCGSCTSEYTPIAHTSGNFNQKKIGGTPLYYIGQDTCGWSGCSLNTLQEITRQEVSQPLGVDYTNCGIKLPYDLVQGDKITICGTTSGPAEAPGTQFFTALTKFTCSGYDNIHNEWVVSTALAFGNFTFNYGATSCWSMEYVVPEGGMLACDTNLLFGIKGELDTSYRFSWTMDIVKLCPGPQDIGCCFTHAKTIFVDPNGNDLTALEGKQTKPWKTIASAVEYLADNTRTGYTIEVFPGDYLNEQRWLFDFKNTDTTIKFNGNVNVGGATTFTTVGKGLIEVNNANIKVIGDDRTNSTFAYGGPGAYIQGNVGNSAIIYSQGTTNISVSNVSMNNDVADPPGIFYEGDTVGGKLTLNEVSLLTLRWNILVESCDRPPVINIKDSVLYVGSDNTTVGYENIFISSIYGSYDPATWIFIENSRLVINGSFAGPDSHIRTDCNNSDSIRGIFNGVLFYWKNFEAIYIWRDDSGNNINVEIINPIVTNHEAWAGASSFNMVTGYGLHINKGLSNPSLYDG